MRTSLYRTWASETDVILWSYLYNQPALLRARRVLHLSYFGCPFFCAAFMGGMRICFHESRENEQGNIWWRCEESINYKLMDSLEIF